MHGHIYMVCIVSPSKSLTSMITPDCLFSNIRTFLFWETGHCYPPKKNSQPKKQPRKIINRKRAPVRPRHKVHVFRPHVVPISNIRKIELSSLSTNRELNKHIQLLPFYKKKKTHIIRTRAPH